MIQELFHIGSLSISPFGVMLMLAFLGAYFQLSRGLQHLGVGDAEDASSLMLWAGLAGIAGAKVYYAILYHDWHTLLERSGLVWYGGFIAGTLAVLLVMRRRHLPAWPTADAVAPALALGYGIGRLGCFLVGDDYGIPTHLPWGLSFPVGLPPTTAGSLHTEFGYQFPPGTPPDALIRVHPTQLYEVALGLLIWGIGVWLLHRQKKSGATALAVLAMLAVERFGVEFLRAKDDRFFGHFTLAQVIALCVLAVVGIVAVVRHDRIRGSAPAT